MIFKTQFDLGDIADFAHDGKTARIRVDEIRVNTFDHIHPGSVITEYREHRGPGRVPTRWWPEKWAVSLTRKL